MKTNKLALSAIVLSTLAACADVPKPGSPEAFLMKQEQIEQAKAKDVQTTMSQVPSWFIKPPADDNSVYGPGTAVSSDLQLAVDKAVLAAKVSVADQVQHKISAKLKSYMLESGAVDNPTVTAESERVMVNLITAVNLAGYQVEDKVLLASGAFYRAYALVQYPIGDANKLLVAQVKKDKLLETTLRASKAYQELERDIEASKNEPPAVAAAPQAEVSKE